MKDFVGEKDKPFDLELFCIFDTSLIKVLYKILLIYFYESQPS